MRESIRINAYMPAPYIDVIDVISTPPPTYGTISYAKRLRRAVVYPTP